MNGELSDLLERGENFKYLFQVNLVDKKRLYLTSYSSIIDVANETYLPNSGLVIESCQFNNSAHNSLFIKGVLKRTV